MKTINRGTIVALAAVFFLGSAGYALAQLPRPEGDASTQIPAPPPGTDTFESLAELGVHFNPGFPLTDIDIDVVGLTSVKRGAVNTMGIIATQLVAMDLTGGGTAVGGMAADSFFDVFVTLNPDPMLASTGQINTRTGNSFFDVFVEITVSQGGQMIGVFHNAQPAHLMAKITAIPPIETAYMGVAPIPLLDSMGNQVGTLSHVQHVPAQPSHAKIKREIISIEKKLDRIIRALRIP